jgi:DNA-binding MarR family transcriptional regulator
MGTRKQSRKTLRTDAGAMVAACAGWNSRLAARRVSHFLDREMAGFGMTVAQLGLMAQIATAEDDTLGALALRAGIDQSTLSRNLRTLETEGLVEIAIVESDQRRRMVWLTETGVRRLEQAIPVWRAANARLARQVPPSLTRTLADATSTLVSCLRSPSR